jgi:hypothetical protein
VWGSLPLISRLVWHRLLVIDCVVGPLILGTDVSVANALVFTVPKPLLDFSALQSEELRDIFTTAAVWSGWCYSHLSLKDLELERGQGSMGSPFSVF